MARIHWWENVKEGLTISGGSGWAGLLVSDRSRSQGIPSLTVYPAEEWESRVGPELASLGSLA